MISTDERITHEGRFDADPTTGEHDERQDRYGFEYCGWCYDHDPRAQFEGPPRQAWPCPWSYGLKALTLHQPWASLVAGGMKRIETRSWSTPYRGWLAIHAGASIPSYLGLGRRGTMKLGDFQMAKDPDGLLLVGGGLVEPYRLPLGAIVAVAELTDCVPMVDGQNHGGIDRPYVSVLGSTLTYFDADVGSDRDVVTLDGQAPYGNFAPGRYAWMLGRVKRVPRAIPCTGHQGLWDVARAGGDVLARATDLVE